MTKAGPGLIRTVYRRTNDYSWWLPELHRLGIGCWFVMDGSEESLGTDESRWDANMAEAEARCGGFVKIWQMMNEPDWHGPASWPLPKNVVNQGLEMARWHFPREKGYTLIAPGLVSGDPAWPEDLRLDLVDGLDVHPYNKFVSSPAEERELAYMLSAYRDWWGLPLWIGEFDSRTDNLPVYLKDFPGVAAALTFCWSSGQTSGEGIHNMGIRENRWAFDNFTEATMPAARPLEFVQGFKQIADRHPDIVGQPLENERGPWTNCSLQKTKNGLLIWGNFAGLIGDQKGFVANDLTRYVWDGSRLKVLG